MTLQNYPDLLSKTHLGKIFGITLRQVCRRVARGWGKAFDWVYDDGRLKATRQSVEAHINKSIEEARRKMTPPTIA